MSLIVKPDAKIMTTKKKVVIYKIADQRIRYGDIRLQPHIWSNSGYNFNLKQLNTSFLDVKPVVGIITHGLHCFTSLANATVYFNDFIEFENEFNRELKHSNRFIKWNLVIIKGYIPAGSRMWIGTTSWGKLRKPVRSVVTDQVWLDFIIKRKRYI